MNTVAEQNLARASAPFQKPFLRNDRRIRLLLLLPIVVVVAVFCFSPNFETAVDRETPFGGDFIQEWIGGHLIASGHASELYDLEAFRAAQHDAELLPFTWPEESYYPAVYPPFYYLVVSPLSALDYRIATFIWGVLSALAIVITAGLLMQYYPACHKYIGCWLAIALLFTPLLTCLNIGHKSTFLLLILTATFVLLRNKRPFAAGLAFAIIAFKPHLFVVVGLTMLIKRQWWFVAGNV